MSCKELIESLKKAADERVSQLWSETEAEAGRIQADQAGRLEQLRQGVKQKQTIMAAERINRAISEANSRARVQRLLAEKALSERLYAMARSSLPLLRNGAYDALFEALVRELPPLPWQVVVVHPDDARLAAKYFPAAEIRRDPAITGGMDVTARDGSIRVINTLEKRLERAWSELEPQLIRDVYHEVKYEAPSAADWGPGVSDGVSADKDQRQTVTNDL